MGYKPIEEMSLYIRAEGIADGIWGIAEKWPDFMRRTVGMQIVRSADSIGANIAEGLGRYHPADVIKFMYYARGSQRETIFWLRRARSRGHIEEEQFNQLITELDVLCKELNQVVSHQRQRKVEQTPSRR